MRILFVGHPLNWMTDIVESLDASLYSDVVFMGDMLDIPAGITQWRYRGERFYKMGDEASAHLSYDPFWDLIERKGVTEIFVIGFDPISSFFSPNGNFEAVQEITRFGRPAKLTPATEDDYPAFNGRYIDAIILGNSVNLDIDGRNNDATYAGLDEAKIREFISELETIAELIKER